MFCTLLATLFLILTIHLVSFLLNLNQPSFASFLATALARVYIYTAQH